MENILSLWDIAGDILKPWNWWNLMANTDANAQYAHDYFLSKTRLPLHTFCILGNIDGECSFRPGIIGDGGSAHGLAQWHKARADLIKLHTGIDVGQDSFAKQCEAMFWEISAPNSTPSIQ